MKKDSYYFSHDSNTMDDPKIMIMVSEFGLEGYGIFWTLIEHLRQQPNYRSKLAILKALAMRYSSSSEKFTTIVRNYDLFIIEDDEFFSLSLNRRMEVADSKRKKFVEWGKKGAEKRAENKRLTHPPITPPQPIKGKERKLKETKEKEIKKKKNTSAKAVNILFKPFREKFEEYYSRISGTEYYWLAKDSVALNRLIGQVKHAYSTAGNADPTEEQMLVGFEGMLQRAEKDKWIKQNFEVTIISSKFNNLKSDGKKQAVRSITEKYMADYLNESKEG